MIPKYVGDGGKLPGGKHETVDITTIVIFFIAGFLVSLPSIAVVMGSLTYSIGIVVLVSLLITSQDDLSSKACPNGCNGFLK